MIKVERRKTKLVELKKYCHLSKDKSFIEVTEWSNGEGVDVFIDNHENQHFSLTRGEFAALQLLMAYEEDE